MSLRPSRDPGSRHDRKWQEEISRVAGSTARLISVTTDPVTSSGSGADTCVTYTLPANFFAEQSACLEFFMTGTDTSFGDFDATFSVGGTIFANFSTTGDSGGGTGKWYVRGKIARKDEDNIVSFYERYNAYDGYNFGSLGAFTAIDLKAAQTLLMTIESSVASAMKFTYGSLILWPGVIV